MLHALPTLSLATLENHMVSIVGGSFLLDEKVTVQLDNFQLCRFPVSQQLWKEVMKNNPDPARFEGHQRPVEQVSWYEAVSFCNQLSEQQGLPPYYDIDPHTQDPNNQSNFDNLKWTVQPKPESKGYRLPTEAEWEYAAREGQHDRKHEFSGSPRLQEVDWYGDNSYRETIPSGYHRPNALGLYELSGNVWEWVWDWYASYPDRLPANPIGPESGDYRVSRGGGWYDSAGYARVSNRDRWHPDDRRRYLGFRLARS